MKALKIIGALVALLGVLVVGMFIGAALMFQPEPQATDASQRVSNQGDGKSAAGTPDQQQDAAQKEQSSGGKENLPELGMNEPVDTGDGTVTVTKASKTDVINLSYDKPIEGNFVVIEFEYVSDRPDSVESPWETPLFEPAFSFRVVDEGWVLRGSEERRLVEMSQGVAGPLVAFVISQ